MASKKQQPEPELTFERKGSPYRHYDFYVGTERINGSTKKPKADVAGAEAVARALRNRAIDEAAARRVAPPPAPEAKDMTWDEAVASYLEFRGDYASKEGEMPGFAFLSERIGGLSVGLINDAVVSDLVAERRKKRRFDRPHLGRISNSAVNSSVTFLLMKVLLHARRKGVQLPQEPFWKTHVLRVRPREREMVIDEEMVLEKVRPDVWPFFNFILETGLRKRPALIRKSQVKWRQGFIEVVGKGQKPQKVEITPEVAEILKKEWHKHPVWVFTFQVRRDFRCPSTKLQRRAGEYVPITYENVQEFWTQTCEGAGVTNLRIHDIRKTTGARMVRTTGDIKAASHVLNHSDISTTARHYTYITSDDVRRRLAQTAAETRRLRSNWTPESDDGSDEPTG